MDRRRFIQPCKANGDAMTESLFPITVQGQWIIATIDQFLRPEWRCVPDLLPENALASQED